jgi:hypothetical protein
MGAAESTDFPSLRMARWRCYIAQAATAAFPRLGMASCRHSASLVIMETWSRSASLLVRLKR